MCLCAIPETKLTRRPFPQPKNTFLPGVLGRPLTRELHKKKEARWPRHFMDVAAREGSSEPKYPLPLYQNPNVFTFGGIFFDRFSPLRKHSY